MFCQWFKNGCHKSRGRQFFSNQQLSKGKNRFVLWVSNNHLIRTGEIQSHHKSGSTWRGDNILNIWQLCFVKCVFRLLWTIEHCSPIVWNHPKHFLFQTTSSHPNFKHMVNIHIYEQDTFLKVWLCGLARYCLRQWQRLNTTKWTHC